MEIPRASINYYDGVNECRVLAVHLTQEPTSLIEELIRFVFQESETNYWSRINWKLACDPCSEELRGARKDGLNTRVLTIELSCEVSLRLRAMDAQPRKRVVQ